MAEDGKERKLSGQEKAALFILALGEDQASKVFSMMDEDEIREISQYMANLGTVSSKSVESLFLDFTGQLSSTGNFVGSYESTERLLNKILPSERVTNIMEEIRGPAGRTMWDKLGNVGEDVLANYLKNEYPQTVAVVLSKIRSDHAAKVLATLPENFSMEVVMRMLRMESVQREILDEVERTLRTEFMSNLVRSTRRDSHELIADILNNMDRQSENRFISALEVRSPEAADKIKALMFTFDDLQKIDPTGIQTLLRNIDKDKLAVALKGSSDEMKELFLSNMSERAAKILREDMESLGPVRIKDVDEAQVIIVSSAKDLAAKGEIFISEGSEEDELVY